MPKTFNELMKFLAEDEEEAIKGYDDVIEQLDAKKYRHVIEQLNKIKREEENHLNFLKEVQKNPDLDYVDEHEEETKPELEEKIKKLFGIEGE